MYITTLIVALSACAIEANMDVYVTDESPIERIGNRLYKKELLTDQFSDPKELAYDSASRNLFFMYMDDEIQNSGRAFINVVTKNAMKVKGIERNKATAVDEETGDVYFGSDDGLYKYDPLDNVARNIGLYNVNVYKIVVRNNEIYVTDANNHMIYKVNDNIKAVKVGDVKTVMEFNVDNERNIHYMTMCGVFCDTGERLVKNTDLRVVYHFIVDDNKVIGVSDDGLYEISCGNGTGTKFAELDFFPRSIILGDYGELYYSIDNYIYRLRPISSYLVYNIYMKSKPTLR